MTRSGSGSAFVEPLPCDSIPVRSTCVAVSLDGAAALRHERSEQPSLVNAAPSMKDAAARRKLASAPGDCYDSQRHSSAMFVLPMLISGEPIKSPHGNQLLVGDAV